jgi:hypothetical protein
VAVARVEHPLFKSSLFHCSLTPITRRHFFLLNDLEALVVPAPSEHLHFLDRKENLGRTESDQQSNPRVDAERAAAPDGGGGARVGGEGRAARWARTGRGREREYDRWGLVVRLKK